jgi:hypothetical protein
LKVNLEENTNHLNMGLSPQTWQHLRLRPGATSDLSQTAKGWLGFLESGLINQLAILLDSPLNPEHSDIAKAILVHIHGEKNGVIITRDEVWRVG